MTLWKPEPLWAEQDAFIIGGGDSLRTWDFTLLKNEHTVGCNQAFRLGPEICDICVFGDKKFILDKKSPRVGFYDELEKFPNPTVTNDRHLAKYKIPWLTCMGRKVYGLSSLDEGTLCWNKNTGSTAINIALLMGAKTIYLLGFDMFLTEGRPNWHDRLLDKPNEKIYVGMLPAFSHVKKDLAVKFPGRIIFNVTNKSNLNTFPKLSFNEFWNERSKHVA